MTVKLFYNLAFVLGLVLAVLAEDINQADAQQESVKIIQPNNIKLLIQSKIERIDSSEVEKYQIPEAKPAVDQPSGPDVKNEGDRLSEPSESINLFNLMNMNPLRGLFENQGESKDEGSEQPTYHRRLFIFRIFPNFGNSDDSKAQAPKLLGGGGENDPDIIRFKLDEDARNMMTGQDHHMITNRVSMHSMMEHIKNMLGFMDSANESDEDEDSTKHLPFVIRTEDGNEAIIPNEIGDETRLKENKNCMMLSFMRLKASIYYRTLLHLLFFTGILLFILSMIMITFRTFRKKRYSTLRYTPHNMDVASIDGDLVKDKSIKSWYGITSDRSTIVADNNKIVLIQAPPAYDQVIVGDSTKLLEDDEAKCDTKSLPPSYDVVNEKN